MLQELDFYFGSTRSQPKAAAIQYSLGKKLA